ncbi:NAD-dependent epimerase/dehydratase family protein [Candidatus Parabeggiatoa sp. HSG14]|uniref:NAD-dependent epimerase/dehydratase family protein n=1 Tax=Candidatus Parabeggiatoa sp. HSG14 TaxID=3055593 RepID=UPI0025A711E1|nr:NAD-dependent epimerase/dehydratase family protein [Thiotrichales bacterium HSG14]
MLTDLNQAEVLVTGATSQIGQCLLPHLQAAGITMTAISRQPQSNTAYIVWQQSNLQISPLSISQSSLLFHVAPLPLLPPLLTHLPNNAPLKKIIAFSSTSCFTKANSPDPKERRIATQLTEAETALITICQARDIAWTLFRPTLIYGCGIDKNVTFIARFIRRFGFFPLVGQGKGLRQPVHADDLAIACVQACLSPKAINKAYNLSGGQTLTYYDMVKAIFHHLGKKPRIMSIPLPLFKFTTRCLSGLPTYAHLSAAMIARMNQDLCFDYTMAYHDFGYQPRTFSDTDMGF